MVMQVARRSRSSLPASILAKVTPRERVQPFPRYDLHDFLAYYDTDRVFEDVFGSEMESSLAADGNEEKDLPFPYKQRLSNFYFPLSNILISNYTEDVGRNRLIDALQALHELKVRYQTEVASKGLPRNEWLHFKRKILMQVTLIVLMEQIGLSIVVKSLDLTADDLPLKPKSDVKFPTTFDSADLRNELNEFMAEHKSGYGKSADGKKMYEEDMRELCCFFSHARGSKFGVDLGKLSQLLARHDIDQFKEELTGVYNKLEDLLLPVPVQIGQYVRHHMVDGKFTPLHEPNWTDEMRDASGPYRSSNTSFDAADVPGSGSRSTPAASQSSAKPVSAGSARKSGSVEKPAAAADAATAVASSSTAAAAAAVVTSSAPAVGSAVNRIKRKYDRMDPIIPAMGSAAAIGSAPAPVLPQQHDKPTKKRSKTVLDDPSDEDGDAVGAVGQRRSSRMPLTEMYRKNLVVDDIEEEGGDQHGEAVGSSVQMLKSSAAAASAARTAAGSFPEKLSAPSASTKRSSRQRVKGVIAPSPELRKAVKKEESEEGDSDNDSDTFFDQASKRSSSARIAAAERKVETSRRVRWTEEETECLKQAVAELGGDGDEKPSTLWRDILNHPDYKEVFMGRTNVNLKDKYRNILKEELRRSQREDYYED